MGRYCKVFSLCALLAFTACSINSPNNPNDSNNTPPAIPSLAALTIRVPQNAPTNIQGMVIAANSITGLGYAYINAVTNSQPAFDNGEWTWKYNNGSLAITLIASSNSDGSVNWQLVLDGTETTTNTVFSNWTAMTGTSSQDGMSGNWVINNLNSTEAAGNATWQTDSQGNVTVKLTTDALVVDAKGNTDGSGEIIIVQNDKKIYEATWTASGGTWIAYDPSTGQKTGEGSWTN
jgi:hypothetical protein